MNATSRAGDIAVALLGMGVVVVLVVAIFAKHIEPWPASTSAPTTEPDIQSPTQPPNTSDEAAAEAVIAILGKAGTLRLRALSAVPTRPPATSKASTCNVETLPVSSSAGSASLAAGWDVVSDQTFGQYQVVIVQSGAHWKAGQGCIPEGTSALIFKGDALQAVAYDKNSKQSDSTLIRAQRIDDKTMRLFAFDGALAELALAPTSISLRELPSFDEVCNGREQVPRIERLSYVEARKRLMSEGWQPLNGTRIGAGDSFASIAEELGRCTPLGKCSTDYAHLGGDAITVATKSAPIDTNGNDLIDIGEDPIVEGYFVACRGG
jgi:hypothetical protein